MLRSKLGIIKSDWSDFGDLLGIFDHAYTHYKVTLHAFFCQLLARDLVLNYHTQFAWVPLKSLQEYPIGKIYRQISKKLQELG